MEIDQQRVTGLILHMERHFLDHLGVLCDMLGVPLRISDPSLLADAKKFYPTLDVRLESDLRHFCTQSLIENYDVLLYSNFLAFNQRQGVEEAAIRTIFCPHGNSDKGHREECMENFIDEDICLIYGQQMLDFLKVKGVTLTNTFITGNYRYQYYLEHKEFYDTQFANEVLSQFYKKQKSILYAPTWHDGEENSSFFDAMETVIASLPAHYNLIVKFHPLLIEQALAAVCFYEERYRAWPNIAFVSDWVPVYPVLNASDIYLGDMSSVGYDFLTFNRPMFFFNTHKLSYPLYQCGVDLHPEEYHTVYQQIDKFLAKEVDPLIQKRQELYQYTFAANANPITNLLGDLNLKPGGSSSQVKRKMQTISSP